MSKELYLAYGSNMCRARLQARISQTELVGNARLCDYRLSFHKRGGDGSGKCNVYSTGSSRDVVYGVLYRLDQSQFSQLDIFEGVGHGYCRKTVACQLLSNGELVQAVLYIAAGHYTDDSLLPFTWYRAYVLAGARQQGLPKAYIRKVLDVRTMTDPDTARSRENTALLEHGREYVTV